LQQPVLPVLVLFVFLVFAGAGGLVYFEGAAGHPLSWADGVWWAVVTMTTVGYGEVAPTSTAARYFVGIPIMILGIGVLGYLLSVAASSFVERRNRAAKGVRKLNANSHVLIIHYQNLSRVQHVVEQLRSGEGGSTLPLVLVDGNLAELPHELLDVGVSFVRGPPELPSTLVNARVEHAHHALVLAKERADPESDFATLAVVTALRTASDNLYIVAECVDSSREELIKRAGANSVICSSGLTSSLLAQEVADPGTQAVVYEFIQHTSKQQIYIVPIKSMSEWKYSALRTQLDGQNATLVGVGRKGKVVLNPSKEYVVEKEDKAICISDTRPDPICCP